MEKLRKRACSSTASSNVITAKMIDLRNNFPLVPRPQLMKELNKFSRSKMIFVCAPAGYGKTTTVAEWVRKQKRKVCWLTLDQSDNQFVDFCRHLSVAIKTLCVDSVEPIPEADIRDVSDRMSLARTLVQGTAALQEDFFIVLDDYHVIEDSYVNDLLGCLLKIAPELMHMIIISRFELPVVGMPRYHLQSQVMELRTKDLRFQANEIAALCQIRSGGVAKEDLQILERVTEGWIAGLHFATLELNATGGSVVRESILADNLYVAEYLETEGLKRFPKTVQEFLLHTSILDKLTPGACDAVTQGENSSATLEFLKRNGAFLVDVDEDGRWSRYHYLYREFLQKNLKNSYKHLLPELHRRAGEWFAQNNSPSKAIDHALQAKDYDQAAEWIIKYAKGALGRGNTHDLVIWLNALPQTLIANNPLLGLAYSWTMLLAGRFELYQMQLKKLESVDFVSFDIPSHLIAKIKNELLLIRAAAASFNCDIDTCLALNREAHGHGSIFTPRELEVLRLLDAGQTNAEIAAETGVTINTVKSHIRSLYRKLGTQNRVQALSQGRKMQLL